MPGAANITGLRSRSTPGGGGYNELALHDAKGKELVSIRAQKDLVTTVGDSQMTVVHGPDQFNHVTQGSQTTLVKHNIEYTAEAGYISLTAQVEIDLVVGNSRIRLKADGTIEVQGKLVNVVDLVPEDVQLAGGGGGYDSDELAKSGYPRNAKFLIAPTDIAGNDIPAIPPLHATDLYPATRSLIGDAYRNSMRAAADDRNSLTERVGYAGSALALAVPGMFNDAAREVLNSPNNLYGGAQTMRKGIDANDPNLFANGLMRASEGLLGATGVAGLGRPSVSVSRANAPVSTRRQSGSVTDDISAAERGLLQEPGAVEKLLHGGRVGEGLPGTAGVVVSRRPTVQEMTNLSAKHDVEFGVTYTLGSGKGGGGGVYTLHSGTKSSVNIGELTGNKILISHTHPKGGASASGYFEGLPDGSLVFKGDQAVLQALQKAGSPQRTSTIIPLPRADGTSLPPFRFSVESSNLDYVISNGQIIPKQR